MSSLSMTIQRTRLLSSPMLHLGHSVYLHIIVAVHMGAHRIIIFVAIDIIYNLLYNTNISFLAIQHLS